MLRDKSQIMSELYYQRGQLDYYKREIRDLLKLKNNLNDSNTLMNQCYQSQCSIFDSRDILNLCQGFGINLTSTGVLGKEATSCVKGRAEKNCRKAYETEINETNRQIKRLEKSIENYNRQVSRIETTIRQLKSELASL